MRVSFDLSPRAEFVFADKIQIQQVLLNLIRNAVEAMQDSNGANCWWPAARSTRRPSK